MNWHYPTCILCHWTVCLEHAAWQYWIGEGGAAVGHERIDNTYSCTHWQGKDLQIDMQGKGGEPQENIVGVCKHDTVSMEQSVRNTWNLFLNRQFVSELRRCRGCLGHACRLPYQLEFEPKANWQWRDCWSRQDKTHPAAWAAKPRLDDLNALLWRIVQPCCQIANRQWNGNLSPA